MSMEEDQINNRGYVICTQCIEEGAVVQQMRPLRDWADHDWYNEAKTEQKKAATADKAAKKKRSKNPKKKKAYADKAAKKKK